MTVPNERRAAHTQRVPIRVLIMNPERAFSESLAVMLNSADDVEVVGMAATRSEAWTAVERNKEVVALIDAESSAGGGATLIADISTIRPDVEVVALVSTDEAVAVAAVHAGACALVSRSDGPEILLSALRDAARGVSRLPASILTRVLGSNVAAGFTAAEVGVESVSGTTRVIDLVSKLRSYQTPADPQGKPIPLVVILELEDE